MNIAVCGSKEASNAVLQKSKELGAKLARNGFAVLTGATIGVSQFAARGAKESGGKTIGISPAKDREEHLLAYKYPVEEFDEIVYTGLGVPARNNVLVGRCDAALFVAGGVGTLNELTIALAKQKLVGVLQGTGGVADKAKEILRIIGLSGYKKIFFARKPVELVRKLESKLRG